MNLRDVTARIPDLPDITDTPDRVLRAVGLARRADHRIGAPSAWLAFGLGLALGIGLGLLLQATDELERAEEAQDL